jgi:hypothetical protein
MYGTTDARQGGRVAGSIRIDGVQYSTVPGTVPVTFDGRWRPDAGCLGASYYTRSTIPDSQFRNTRGGRRTCNLLVTAIHP